MTTKLDEAVEAALRSLVALVDNNAAYAGERVSAANAIFAYAAQTAAGSRAGGVSDSGISSGYPEARIELAECHRILDDAGIPDDAEDNNLSAPERVQLLTEREKKAWAARDEAHRREARAEERRGERRGGVVDDALAAHKRLDQPGVDIRRGDEMMTLVQRIDELVMRIGYWKDQADRPADVVQPPDGHGLLRLDKPALVGATAFGEGIAWSMVIECAQRAYENSRKPLDFDPGAAKKIVDEIRASGKYTIDAAKGVGTSIEIDRLKRKLAEARARRDELAEMLGVTDKAAKARRRFEKASKPTSGMTEYGARHFLSEHGGAASAYGALTAVVATLDERKVPAGDNPWQRIHALADERDRLRAEVEAIDVALATVDDRKLDSGRAAQMLDVIDKCTRQEQLLSEAVHDRDLHHSQLKIIDELCLGAGVRYYESPADAVRYLIRSRADAMASAQAFQRAARRVARRAAEEDKPNDTVMGFYRRYAEAKTIERLDATQEVVRHTDASDQAGADISLLVAAIRTVDRHWPLSDAVEDAADYLKDDGLSDEQVRQITDRMSDAIDVITRIAGLGRDDGDGNNEE